MTRGDAADSAATTAAQPPDDRTEPQPPEGGADQPSAAAPHDPAPEHPHDPPQDASPSAAGSRFGRLGAPLNGNSPLYVGFVGAIGVLLAINLLRLMASVSQALTLIFVAAFLAIGMDPAVKFLCRRGMRRAVAVTLVFLGLLAVVAGFLATVLPVAITQGAQLVDSLPAQVAALQHHPLFERLEREYGMLSQASAELTKRLKDQQLWVTAFGGLVGAGRAVANGVFSTFTVLVLTLYFMASLPSITEAGYRLVPASRRHRVQLLTEEILKRIGGYVAGQILVASINGLCSFVFLVILGIPYPAVLALTVALLGLIPLIGGTLGGVLVALVGLFDSGQTALIIAVYYLLYQQVENYLIVPRIMSRTVSVPGGIALVAALVGGSLLGILGAFVAIPLAAAVLLLVNEVVIPRQDRS